MPNNLSKEYLKSFLGAFRFNLRGKKIKDKLIIIESDDWGAIRTPSSETLSVFKKKGFSLTDNIYNVDALESRADIDGLFEVLNSVKGSDGKAAKFTANAVMANPENRTNGLNQLEQLLKQIKREWSDAEFMTSVELGELIFDV